MPPYTDEDAMQRITDGHDLSEWTAALHQGLLMDVIVHIVERDSPHPRRAELQEALAVAFLAGRQPRPEIEPDAFTGSDAAAALVGFARAVAGTYGPAPDTFAAVVGQAKALEGLLGQAEANPGPGLTIPLLVCASELGRVANACEVAR